MPTHLRCCRILMALLVMESPTCAVLHAQPVARSLRGVEAQFGVGGLAASKLLQQFHLPSSPNDLLAFTLEYALKQKLGNTLPLALDANTAFATIDNNQLPGGAFKGQPLSLTAASLRTALLPGDYVLPVMAYCTQYSVHRPGQGTAYTLAPVRGTQAEAISTLLWRGTLAGKGPQELQATNWAIQSGVTYGSLPKSYQALIDQLIPEYRDRLRGSAMEVAEATYRDATTDPRKFLQEYIHEHYGKTVPLMILPKMAVPAPPLDVLLARMGPAGALVLDAKKQSNILLTAYTSRERGEQVLFAGQGAQLPPEPAAEGPWTVRIPGVAYMRFVIQGGNMQRNNLMQIRILPSTATSSPQASASAGSASALLLASYPASQPVPATAVPITSAYGLLGVTTFGTGANTLLTLTAAGVIGYAQGGAGAQALIPVAEFMQSTPAVVKKLMYKPIYYNLSRRERAAGVCIYLGGMRDKPQQYPDYNWEQQLATSNDVCGVNTVLQDPCQKDPGFDHSPLYRPDPVKSKKFQGVWGWNDLFRDLPQRPRSVGDMYWNATTQYVGVPASGSPVPVVEFITYGFSIKGSVFTLDPLVINGKQVDAGGTYVLDDPGPDGLTAKRPEEACLAAEKYRLDPAPPPPGTPMMPGTGSAQLQLPSKPPADVSPEFAQADVVERSPN